MAEVETDGSVVVAITYLGKTKDYSFKSSKSFLAYIAWQRIERGEDEPDWIAALGDAFFRAYSSQPIPVQDYEAYKALLANALPGIDLSDSGKIRKNTDKIDLVKPGYRSRLPELREKLGDKIINAVSVILAALKAGGGEASFLRKAFARAGYHISQADETPSSNLEVPTVAPKLWSDRTKDDPKDPSAFIREIYKEWLPHKLAKQDLRHLDITLYNAYAQRIKKGSKHETDTVEFAPKHPRSDCLDIVELGARRRAQADAHYVKKTAIRDNLPQPK